MTSPPHALPSSLLPSPSSPLPSSPLLLLPAAPQREVDTLRRQLREAGQQLEGYILVSRSRKNQAGGRAGRDDVDDDLALPSDGAWDF